MPCSPTPDRASSPECIRVLNPAYMRQVFCLLSTSSNQRGLLTKEAFASSVPSENNPGLPVDRSGFLICGSGLTLFDDGRQTSDEAAKTSSAEP